VRLGRRRLLARLPHAGVWYRAVPPQFAGAALGFEHTPEITSRFNAGSPDRPGLPLLYVAEHPEAALLEVRVLLSPGRAGGAVPNPVAGAVTLVPVRVQLAGVVDLCDEAQLRLLDTSIQELTGDWEGYSLRPHRGPHPPLVPTQRLGAALFRTPRVEGFLTYSARSPTRRNLVIFPTKLRPGSRVEVTDPSTGRVLSRLP
jgi:hypothetical protein